MQEPARRPRSCEAKRAWRRGGVEDPWAKDFLAEDSEKGDVFEEIFKDTATAAPSARKAAPAPAGTLPRTTSRSTPIPGLRGARTRSRLECPLAPIARGLEIRERLESGRRREAMGRLFLMHLEGNARRFLEPEFTAESCLQVGDSCSSARDCGVGLYCGDCAAAGRTRSSCIRDLAIQPTSIVKGLPFNRYSWLVTHNSFSIVGEPSRTGVERVTFYNQEDTVTNQLRNGVRGLMLDMYDFGGDVWLCHSLQGQCYNFTAFEPAIDTLKEVEAFLSENPRDCHNIHRGLRPFTDGIEQTVYCC